MSPPSEERLAWLTGFTGSAGLAVVLAHEAAFFVDGRYTLQAANRSMARPGGSSRWSIRRRRAGSRNILNPGDRLGFDPWLHTIGRSRAACGGLRQGRRRTRGRRQQPGRCGLDRTAAAAARAGHHPRSAICRRGGGREARANPPGDRQLGADALVLSDRHAVAWTFNIRGGDVAHTPLAAVLRAGAQERPSDAFHRQPQALQQRTRSS